MLKEQVSYENSCHYDAESSGLLFPQVSCVHSWLEGSDRSGK